MGIDPVEEFTCIMFDALLNEVNSATSCSAVRLDHLIFHTRVVLVVVVSHFDLRAHVHTRFL